MENNEIKTLIETFKEYRDLIGPIEQNLRSFSLSFDSISEDIKNLNSGFDGSIQSKLDKIYKELSSQAEKARTLTSEVDRFLSSTSRYVSGVDNLIKLCEKIDDKLSTVSNIQSKAESQIEKLDGIIEDKKKTYDLKSLEKKLETYNVGVQKVSEYINTDVSEVLKNNSDTITQIKDKNNIIYDTLVKEKDSIEKLAESYIESSKVLKKISESGSVNEEYIYDILDRWAEDRRVKIKK